MPKADTTAKDLSISLLSLLTETTVAYFITHFSRCALLEIFHTKYVAIPS